MSELDKSKYSIQSRSNKLEFKKEKVDFINQKLATITKETPVLSSVKQRR